MAYDPGNYETLNLYQLYQRVLGAVGLPYPAAKFDPQLDPSGTAKAIFGQFNKQSVPEPGQPYGEFDRKNSVLGRAYFMPTKLNDFQLWNEPLVSLSGKKNVITTAVAGSNRRGSVKEIISIEDYEVRIRGFIVNEQNPEVYPEADVRKFRELFELNQSITIDCLLLHLFNIRQVVLTGFDFPEMEGFPGVQAYNITALSDEPFEYELKNPLNRL